MTQLLTLHSLSKSFGTEVLFQNISFTISEKDRIGLVGPNGAGKSTLLKILKDLEKPDAGTISKRQRLKLAYASQAPEFPDLSIEEVLSHEVVNGEKIEIVTRARILLRKAEFTDYNVKANTLSGGWKKRLSIVQALMNEPDLLLLDEPTNHLDLEGILWLEKFLNKEKMAYLVISHDRYFLENVTNKIIELNRCYKTGIFISEGSWSSYQEKKTAVLEAQIQEERALSNEARQEINWLRTSPKARTTKSRARIDRAEELISNLSRIKSRNTVKKVEIDFVASDRETKKLLTCKNLSKSLGGKTLFSKLDLNLSPGSCLGIVGKNGTGKTTLLKVLAGLIPADLGTVKYANDLKLVYFDQHRESIPSDVSLKRALAPNSDMVNYRGQLIHVNGWAEKFLFHKDRLEMPVRFLSGGERARILIAKLMLEPADILFLDEPTNDLDIDTLEVMEESLKEFSGAVVLISHDRCLMDNICTKILGLGIDEKPEIYADYLQWENSCKAKENKPIEKAPSKPVEKTPTSKKKLSFHEQKELDQMEEAISKKEKEIEKLHNELKEHQNNSQKSLEIYHLLAKEEHHLHVLFERWQDLLNKI